jgi:N4-gp56 family major capsid protein
MQVSEFTNTFLHASPRDNDNNPMRTGFIGTFLNVDIYISGNAREYADEGDSSTVDVYIALFIGREAYGVAGIGNIDPREVDGAGNDPFANNTGKGRSLAPVDLIVKPLGSGGTEDPLNQRGTVAWKAALDTVMLNSSWIISLEHANAFSAA